jgi:lipopolysaccharide/colanic/teichoic acid biosynthesis glycosyltransferase
VLVSEQEGLPRSVLEALCLETPVIGSDIRGTRELLEDGAGWLVPVGDADQLARAMSEVIASPDEARARGRRGRQKVLEGYDQESILRCHECLYARLLESTSEGQKTLSPWERLQVPIPSGVAEGRVRADAPPGADASPWARRLKRAIDFAAALAGLMVLAPLLAVLALAIRLNMGSPVFFRQRRPGRGGAPFVLVKFRTMRTASGPDGQPLPDAKRLTRLGRLLRTTSLDELPQLWNVLRGEMSMVGPRPLLMEYLALYTAEQARRHEVAPGITGWAQVNGRNALSWEQKFAHDLWYVDHWSLTLDLKILGLTALKVLRREGIRAAGAATATPFQGTHHNPTGEATPAWKPSGSSAAAGTPRS